MDELLHVAAVRWGGRGHRAAPGSIIPPAAPSRVEPSRSQPSPAPAAALPFAPHPLRCSLMAAAARRRRGARLSATARPRRPTPLRPPRRRAGGRERERGRCSPRRTALHRPGPPPRRRGPAGFESDAGTSAVVSCSPSPWAAAELGSLLPAEKMAGSVPLRFLSAEAGAPFPSVNSASRWVHK